MIEPSMLYPDTLFSELDTPTVLVDLDVAEANMRKMAEATAARGVGLRPHIKTHKSVYFAHRQLAHGAVGIAVAKIGEAEVMINGGVTDVLLAYPPIGPIKLRRLAALMDRARIIVSIDSVEAAEGLSDLGRKLDREIEVYVDVDTGLHRMGLPPGEPSAELAQKIDRLSHVRVIGIMSHCGHVGREKTPEALAKAARGDAERLVETANLARKAGIAIETVSPGSTPASLHHIQVEGVTEIRPGTYIFNDANCVGHEISTVEECAVTVLSTVVSRPSPDRAVADSGSKTLTNDGNSKRRGFGIVKGIESAYVSSLSEEHGVLELTDPSVTLKVGDRIRIVPNHVCPVVNLTDELVAVRGDELAGTIPVSARGKRQ